MEQIDTPETVIQSLLNGQYDEQLQQISDACHDRKKRIAVQAGHQLRDGDRVEFTEGRPRYLIGEKATVIKVMQTWVSLRLDRSVGKFSQHGTIRSPMSCIKKI